MKRILIGLATSALIFTNCSKIEVVETAQNTDANAIGFSTYSNIATKGAIFANNTDFATNDREFKVTAFINVTGWDNSYMETWTGIKYNSTDTKWGYSDASKVRFWPATESLDFYAYYHETATSTIAATKAAGMTFTDYTVDINKANQNDFLYARELAKTKDDADANGRLQINFKHALTQILFKVKEDNSSIKVKITEISLCNINSKGNFTVSNEPTEPSWSNASEKKNYTFYNGEGQDVTATAETIGSAQILLPQTITGWVPSSNNITANDSGAKNAYLKVKATITATDGASHTITYLDNGYLYFPISGTWEKGKKITYTLDFGGSTSTTGGAGYDENSNPTILPINFTTDVEGWTDGSETITL